MRIFFWTAVVLGAISSVLAVVTLITREWIELGFGFDPDKGSGALEWSIVMGAALIAGACLTWARAEWVRGHSATG